MSTKRTSTKHDILLSAYADFYAHGFAACGVEFLAKQAGVTKKTLYAHFHSKEALIEAVLAYRDEQFIQHLAQFFDQHNNQSVIDTYLSFIATWTAKPDFHGCLFINASAELPDASPHIQAQIHQHKRTIKDILHHKMQQEGIQNAAFLADFLFVIGEGMIVAKQTGQNHNTPSYHQIAQSLHLLKSTSLD